MFNQYTAPSLEPSRASLLYAYAELLLAFVLVCFVENMLSSINKIEQTKRTRQMRAAKDTFVLKEVACTSVVHVQFEQDEHIASGLVFKRRR
ncbi:hypothetical protein VNO80_19220 [Phaseolus coccineus]|uniref:Uncharacterized protein n=1 Tax=Phaseolus coccineus TaxID=3886 RepID=A0AAN9MLT7_PHACN